MILRVTMLELMRTSANGVVALEMLMMHISEEAAQLDAAGQSKRANVLRNMVRNHKVRMLEIQQQIDVLCDDYAKLFHDLNNKS